MQSKRLTTEPPCITEEVFEECLATDDMLVDYFNEFLSLPTFAQPVKFNSDVGVFEVVNYAPRCLESQLKKNLHDQKPSNPIYDVLSKAKNDGQLSKMHSASPAFNMDPNYNTMCLDREQAIQWIKKERLPAFLGSDCYFEYRLAKLISQVEWSKTGMNFIIDSDYYPWIRKQDLSSPHPEEHDTSLTMKKFYVSLGQATVSQVKDWFTLAKQGDSTRTTDSSTHPVTSSQIQNIQHERDKSLGEKDSLLEAGSLSEECQQQSFLSPSRTASAKADAADERSSEAEEGSSVAIAEPPSHRQLRVYLDPKWDSAAKEENEQESTTFQTPEELKPASTQIVMKEPISELTHQPAADTVACSTAESHFKQSSSPFTALDSKGDVRKQDPEEVSLCSSSESGGPDSRAAWCLSHGTYDTGNRREFERFKKFIKGTLGERYWWLWMDIERLKALKNTTRQQRHLSKMKKLYLLSSGDYFLSSEVLLRLDLLHGDQWNIRHLRQIQPEVVKPLLLYWGPRFCVTHSTAIEAASAKLKFWHTCQERPRVDIDPFPQIVSLLPLTQKSCISGIQPSLLQRSSRLPPTLTSSQSTQQDDIPSSRMWSKSVSTDMIHCLALDGAKDSRYQGYRKYTYAELLRGKSAAGSVVLGGSRMESMLQSLYLENRAGYYFTEFCEKSGNKLWKNCVYFWFDLQAYHQLFYQETVQPFQICKQAQFLYATYIAPSASMDIGLHQNKRDMIYQKMDPAFEDLFDPAEEYILTILLEPWMEMVEADKYTYGKVELVEETRQLDSVCFTKLQALHQVSGSKKDESTVADTGLPSFPDDQYLRQVPKGLASPNLSDLIHDKEKLKQFWAFLNEHSAGMDLMCWLDIEEFRKMLHEDKEKIEEKSKDIENKYFNDKYFFGPNSPATREQQEKLMHSGGGRRQILHDQLSAAVLLEVQQCIQKRLEKQWLPLFLADEHRGVERQAKVMDITEDILRKDQQKTTRIWKHMDNKCVSSSSEIIAFRKALLDPVTANLFQRFVSLQGDLLGNGVLFWQEVQKYKDLCHSHCADAIVQKKITAIINCFINSAIPPALQIDIPPEQAKKILEHRKELGPYIFREAQMSVFALLFKFWPEFCKLQSNVDSEKILLALEREKEKKMRKKERITAKGKEAERKLINLTKLSRRALTQLQKSGLTQLQKSDLTQLQKSDLTQLQKSDLAQLPRSALTQMPKSSLTQLAKGALVDTIDMKRGSAPSLDGFGWEASWSYSKYIEALEQERILIKRDEDLEETSSSFLSDSLSVSSLKPESSMEATISTKRKLSNVPKTQEAL
ncbi:regulator of G-protein signaling 22 isoform X2 [Neopelma chrysocephalum]|uniref:regulator of G-protein signaling 22 isoform X2 n=1 Tax=Neopelma chrysocephalum TaxID=114329 RepID=UPI000FCD28D5|nr:regulator of G-protein signaling 22 isoform X2 [Neopelma chrysocephalum]